MMFFKIFRQILKTLTREKFVCLFFLRKKFVLLIGQKIWEKKKKNYFYEKENVSGNQCWHNGYFFIWKTW